MNCRLCKDDIPEGVIDCKSKRIFKGMDTYNLCDRCVMEIYFIENREVDLEILSNYENTLIGCGDSLPINGTYDERSCDEGCPLNLGDDVYCLSDVAISYFCMQGVKRIRDKAQSILDAIGTHPIDRDMLGLYKKYKELIGSKS